MAAIPTEWSRAAHSRARHTRARGRFNGYTVMAIHFPPARRVGWFELTRGAKVLAQPVDMDWTGRPKASPEPASGNLPLIQIHCIPTGVLDSLSIYGVGTELKTALE